LSEAGNITEDFTPLPGMEVKYICYEYYHRWKSTESEYRVYCPHDAFSWFEENYITKARENYPQLTLLTWALKTAESRGENLWIRRGWLTNTKGIRIYKLPWLESDFWAGVGWLGFIPPELED
jgi:hypothetical protein